MTTDAVRVQGAARTGGGIVLDVSSPAPEPVRPSDDTTRPSTAVDGPQPVGCFDRPLAEPLEGMARTAASRFRSPWRSPAAVALAGYASTTFALLVLGVLLVHLGALSGVRGWDDHLNQWFAERRTTSFDDLSAFFTQLANTVPVVLGAVVVELVLVFRRRWRELLLVPIGLAVELAVFLTVNETVRRPRPSVPKLGIEPSTFSFPSGHIAATLVLYGSASLLLTLALRRTSYRWVPWLAWAFTAVLVVSVGLSRVYRGMHHPIDVLAGAMLGVVCLIVGATATRASALAASGLEPPAGADTDQLEPSEVAS